MVLKALLLISAFIWISYQLYALLAKKRLLVSGESSKELRKVPDLVQLAEITFILCLFVYAAGTVGIEWILVLLTIGAGVLWFAHAKYFKHQTKETYLKNAASQARGFFLLLFAVLLLRSFYFEPFRIPTGSLKPTLLDGDFILVNKYQYGFRLPITHNLILATGKPKVGDIMVFRWPPDPSVDFIKRVIGVPGDHIRYEDKRLYVNDELVPQAFYQSTTFRSDQGQMVNVDESIETLNGLEHHIYVRPDVKQKESYDVTVPEAYYFMMGDNRDGSFDSRGWGFVPEANIVGRASRIWFSWDSYAKEWKDKIRFNRLWKNIKEGGTQ